jgi:hypothetical protein
LKADYEPTIAGDRVSCKTLGHLQVVNRQAAYHATWDYLTLQTPEQRVLSKSSLLLKAYRDSKMARKGVESISKFAYGFWRAD